jgi:G6PDH family F420-dependent oxidoreductase
MLEEAVEVMRKLWTGEFVDHDGEHYVVENARVYTLPAEQPKVYVSGFGPKSIDLAARIGDGFVSTKPEAEHVKRFRSGGGGDKVAQGGYKACWAPTVEQAVDIAHEKWPNSGVPGELSQVLPSPRHFEQAAQLVTKDQIKQSFVCGPEADPQLEMIGKYADAGYDEVYVANAGPNYRELIDLYAKEVLPQVH